MDVRVSKHYVDQWCMNTWTFVHIRANNRNSPFSVVFSPTDDGDTFSFSFPSVTSPDSVPWVSLCSKNSTSNFRHNSLVYNIRGKQEIFSSLFFFFLQLIFCRHMKHTHKIYQNYQNFQHSLLAIKLSDLQPSHSYIQPNVCVFSLFQ